MQRLEQHGNRWRATWQRDGQRFRRSFASRASAAAFLHQLEEEEARRARLAGRADAPVTVTDIVDAYYQTKKRRLEESTQNHYEQIIARHIVAEIGDLNAGDLADDPAPLHDFYDELPPTVATHAHQILSPAFQYAVDRKRVYRNPCLIARPRRPRRKPKLIPLPEDVEKILAAAWESRDFGLYCYIVARVGLRRGEALALRWEDLDFDRCLVHVRRSIARKKGGSYIKLPKSGETRTIHMSPRFFDRLEPFRRLEGWLFPRAYNCPYLAGDVVTPQSSAGRILVWLDREGGEVTCPDGRAGTRAAQAVGLRRYSAAPALRWLEQRGYIERDMKPCHIYRIGLTAKGLDAVESWHDDGMPWFPTTADQKFRKLMKQLGMPHTLHSLRHFVATHLYNRKRDWVQLARFLGHTNPAITMVLYANHVVEVSQLELGEAAMDLFDDLALDDPADGVPDARPGAAPITQRASQEPEK